MVLKEELKLLEKFSIKKTITLLMVLKQVEVEYRNAIIGAKYLFYDPFKTMKKNLICIVGKQIIDLNGTIYPSFSRICGISFNMDKKITSAMVPHWNLLLVLEQW